MAVLESPTRLIGRRQDHKKCVRPPVRSGWRSAPRLTRPRWRRSQFRRAQTTTTLPGDASWCGRPSCRRARRRPEPWQRFAAALDFMAGWIRPFHGRRRLLPAITLLLPKHSSNWVFQVSAGPRRGAEQRCDREALPWGATAGRSRPGVRSRHSRRCRLGAGGDRVDDATWDGAMPLRSALGGWVDSLSGRAV